jgi:hypothetical protein
MMEAASTKSKKRKNRLPAQKLCSYYNELLPIFKPYFPPKIPIKKYKWRSDSLCDFERREHTGTGRATRLVILVLFYLVGMNETGLWPDPMNGEKIKVRAITRFISQDEFIYELYMVGPDSKEFKTLENRATRKK